MWRCRAMLPYFLPEMRKLLDWITKMREKIAASVELESMMAPTKASFDEATGRTVKPKLQATISPRVPHENA